MFGLVFNIIRLKFGLVLLAYGGNWFGLLHLRFPLRQEPVLGLLVTVPPPERQTASKKTSTVSKNDAS